MGARDSGARGIQKLLEACQGGILCYTCISCKRPCERFATFGGWGVCVWNFLFPVQEDYTAHLGGERSFPFTVINFL